MEDKKEMQHPGDETFEKEAIRDKKTLSNKIFEELKEISVATSDQIQGFYYFIIFVFIIALSVALLSKLVLVGSNVNLSEEYIKRLRTEMLFSSLYMIIEHALFIWAVIYTFLREKRLGGIVVVWLLIFNTFFGPYFLGDFLMTDCIIQGFTLDNSTFRSCFNATSLQNYSSIMDCILLEGKAMKKCICSVDLLKDSYFKYAFLMFLEHAVIIGIGALMKFCVEEYLRKLKEIIEKDEQ